MFVAQTEVPCLGHPLDLGKSDPRWPVSWLTGHRAACAFPEPQGSSGCDPIIRTTMQAALAAYSCRDSLGFGAENQPLTAFPLSPLGRQREIVADGELSPRTAMAHGYVKLATRTRGLKV